LRPLARRAAALVIFASLAASHQTLAQPSSPDEMAQRHHERGTIYYNLGQFEEAIAEYRKGYEQKANPTFLFNIAQSYQQLGAAEKALFFYRRYISTTPDAPNRKDVETRISELEQRTGPVRHAAPPNAPVPEPAPLSADRPDLQLAAPGPAPAPAPGPVWQRWWFWAGVGGVVLGGVAAALILSGGRGSPHTELGTSRFLDRP
jgi:tetratricopeptide (TPR) repeat protein